MFFEAPDLRRHALASSAFLSAVFLLSALLLLPAVSVHAEVLQSDDFESGFGNWTNAAGDDIEWTRDSGGTPSTGTGPSGDHTTGSGFYLFTESSTNGTGFPDKVALLESPCIDLSNRSDATWSFWYYMEGAAMGTLNAEVAAGCGTTWTNAWNLSGDQGTSWSQQTVDLTAYVGTSVRLRFRGVTGSDFTSDLTVDDVVVDATLDNPCSGDAECDDGIACTTDTCVATVCQNVDSCSGEATCNMGSGLCEMPPPDIIIVDSGIDTVVSVDPVTGDRTVISSTSVGTGDAFIFPRGIALEADGNFVVCDQDSDTVIRVDPATGNRTIVSSATVGTGTNFDICFDIIVEADGNLIVADTGLTALVRVDPVSGNRTTLASNSVGAGPAFVNPSDIALAANDDIIVADGSGTDTIVSVDPVSGDRTLISGGAAGTGTAFGNLSGLAIDTDGTYVVSDTTNNSLTRVDPVTGDRTVFSSSTIGSGPAFSTVLSITLEPDGSVLNLNSGTDEVIRADPTTGDRVVMASASVGGGVALTDLRDLFVMPVAGGVCGDGNVDAGESCDDGNTVDGDCCSATCSFETSGSSCEDGDLCSEFDTCDGAGTCNAGSAVVCDDGLFCNGAETCDSGLGCQAGIAPVAAPVADDGVACTNDSCDEVGDVIVNAPDDLQCDNGLFCDGSETCDVLLDCQAGTAPPTDDGVSCTDDSCDETGDVIVNTVNNANCDNGLFCDGSETCDAVLDCQGGVAPTVDDGVSCTDDSCDEVADAIVNATNDGNCDNGLFCDGSETCDAALDCQAGTAPTVDDGVSCTDDSCDEVADAIVNTTNDGNCDNGLFCDGSETCDAALDCQAGVAPSTDDGVGCTDDSCDEASDSIVNTVNNANCDNGLFCDGSETCDAALDCQAGTAPTVDDGVSCTDDSCDEVADAIVNTTNDGNCDNGLFCDGSETCDAVLDCQGGVAPTVDDGVSCTDDSCDEVGDVVVNAVNDGNCDNGLFCDGSETCDAALDCQAGTAPSTDDGVGCTDDTCDEASDSIVNTVNDGNCDNGLFCDGSETCDAALDCQAGTAPSVDDGVSCTDDSCDEVGDVVVNATNNANCDNGLFCDGSETCDAALDCQAGTAPTIDDGIGCTDDSCDEAGDVVVNATNNANCDNGLFCDGSETCDAALDCQAGTAPSVDDGVSCTDDSCDEVGDVVVNAVNDGNCDNGLFCDGSETCDAALDCQAGTAPSTDDGIGCTDDTCDEASDTVVNTVNDGNCDNGLFCDGSETCDAALDCQAGTAPSTDDGVSCTDDSCDEVADAIVHAANDGLCGNGVFCDGSETCDAVLGCQAATNPCEVPLVCDEGADACVGCINDADCSNGLFCDGVETCNAGNCEAGTPPTVDDGVGCTDDSCDEASDAIVNAVNNANCDNGLFCDGSETCDAVLDCQAGTAPTVDDGVSCTDDSCDEAGDVVVNAVNNANCDNGLFCDGSETCDAVLDCQAGTSPPADDGVACTDDSCDEGTDSVINTVNDANCDNGLFCDGSETCDAVLDCQAGTAPSVDDGVGCTDDSCDEGTDSVVNTVNDANCDNGLFCDGSETCDAVLDCQAGTAPAIDDGVACTDDSCDEASDTIVNATNDGLCDNGQFCDGSETCDALLGCEAGSAPPVDDGVACTDDSCDEGSDSIVNTVNDANCDNGLFCDGSETCDAALDCQAGTAPTIDDGIGCTDDSCDEAGDVVVNATNDANCDNGLFCDGSETCDAVLDCQAGTAPSVDDGVGCTDDSCDEAGDTIVNTVDDANCDNGLFCDGSETCDAVLDCQAGGDPCVGQICDESGDFCHGPQVDRLDENFDTDAGPFAYQDDTFRGTANPSFADGTYEGAGGQTGGGLRVIVGANSTNMSGGWVANFDTTGTASPVDIEVSFRLLFTGGYESDEVGQALLSVDGTLIGVNPNDYLFQFSGDASTNWDSGWVTEVLSITLDPGTHQIIVGGFNDKSTVVGEVTEVFFDNVKVTETVPGCIDDLDCDDGLFCNGPETCNTGVCSPGIPPVLDDGVSCTDDSCDEGADTVVNAPNNGLCDNGLFCDGSETCDPVLDCQAGTAPSVDDAVACTDDSCDEVGDAVVNTPNAANCDNGQFCDGSETCDTVLDCQAGTPPTIDDGVLCTVDSCDEVGDAIVNAPSNALCSNGQFCDGSEICDPVLDCQAGVAPPVDDGVGCTDDSCDEGTDSIVNVVNDGNCDNGLFCDGSETCDAALDCQAGTAPTIDDGVSCTDDSCDEVADAIVNVVNDGNCDNGLYCDGSETCDAALDCQAGTAPTVDDGVSCTDDSCDEGTDSVVNTVNDANCDNGLFCDGSETCDAVLDCQAGTAPTVDDGVSCTDDSCDEVADAVVNAVNDGNCDNGLFCDGSETCDAALDCQAGTAPTVDDGVSCTDDSCDEVADVIVNATNDGNCDNGLFCDGSETCDAALDCQAGTAPTADDGVSCTDDSCDEGTDSIVNVVNDGNCDNGLFCDGSETCDAALDCQAGTAPATDDGIACTDDSCDEASDTIVNATNNALCDNGQFCDGSETCDALLGCEAGSAPSVDDGVGCTDDSCDEGTDSIVNTVNDTNCDNGLFCDGSETCDPALDCQAGSDPCPGQSCDDALDVCVAVGAAPRIEAGVVSVDGTPVTVPLANTYLSAVVVASANYVNNTTPIVVRVSNVTSTSFDVWLQNPGGGPVVADTINYMVAEEGVWTINGVDIEAQTYLSTVTDSDSSWVGEAQTYSRTYTNPVVVGQVMSANDAAWSHFWDQGASRTDPPSATALSTGKSVAEDSNVVRVDETIGFIVFEASGGTLGGVQFEAALGADTVLGIDDAPPYTYTFNTPFSSAPQVAVVTLAAVDGANGGYAQTLGSPQTTATQLFLSIDEDTIGDTERSHTSEQVAYVAFEAPFSFAGCSVPADCDDAQFCNGVEDCVAGACVPGTPPTVDDGVSCTVDSCDEVGDAIVNAPNDGLCSNGLFCDGAEVCDAVLDCQTGTAPATDDGVSCTDDSCDEVGDAIVNAPNAANCDNGQFCDGSETCDAVLDCQAGTPPTIDDGVLCTVDSCDEVGDAIVNAPSNALCSNGQFCDGSEICDLVLDCQAGVAPSVDDGVGCTDDSCDEASDTIINTVNDGNCDNGLYCDGGETCDALLDCQTGTAPSADDGVPCTDDSCDEATDSIVNATNDANCDNGLFCDGSETCDAVLDCQGGTAPVVDDGVSCTDDSCDEVADTIVNATNDGNCDNGLFCDGSETCDAALDCQAGTAPPIDDGIGCTDDSCDEASDTIINTVNDGNCDNGLFCDGSETCDAALDCQAGTAPSADDGVSCTDDSCDEATDSIVNATNDANCDNGLFCDGSETCDAALDCQAGTAPSADDGVPCTDDSCDEATDSIVNATNDANCDNGLFCDGSETCDAALDCQAGTAPPIDDGIGCTDDSCDEASDAIVNTVNDGNCDNGLYCDGSETCDAALDCQAGTAPSADDGVSCTDDSCDEASDTIVNATNDANCDNGLFCDGAETCDAALDCQAGTPPTVNDGVACTDDSCDEAADVVVNATNDSNCDNGLFCDGSETCDAGLGCQAGSAPSADDGVSCTDDSCDEVGDAIVNTTNDANCDNGLFCDGSETCDALLDCQAGAVPPIDDGVSCTDDSCDEATDSIAHAVNSANCDNGQFCDGSETCDAVLDCQAGTPPATDDGVSCTDDSCDEASDVIVNAANDGLCGNGQFCDGAETCDELLDCQPGTPVTGDDGVGCTDDSCDEATDSIVNTVNDASCDNGLYCDGGETCDAALDCQVGTAPSTDDGVSCTDDSCDEATDSIVNTVNDANCDNGTFCDGAETCDALLDCQVGTAPAIDDGVPCTDDSCDEAADVIVNATNDANCDNGLFCDGGEICDAVLDCQVGTAPTLDDGVGCTDDSCDEGTDSIVHAVNNASCDNGQFCDGSEFCDPALDCQVGTPVSSDDGVGCTTDSCDEVSDTVVNVPDDLACDNGLYCDGDESCNAVLDCQSGTPPFDDDGVSCTVGSCDEGADAFVHTPDDLLCDDGDQCTADICDAVTGCSNVPIGGCNDFDVVISEIMYHPAGDTNDEFIEVYNSGAALVDVTDWCFVSGIDYCFAPGTVLSPGQIVVLARDAAQFQLVYGFAPDDQYDGALANEGEFVTLINEVADIISQVAYLDESPWPITPDGQGPSLELIDPDEEESDPRNWHASTDVAGHTAGLVNSVAGVGLPPGISAVSHGSVIESIDVLVTADVVDATSVQLFYRIGSGAEVGVTMLDDGLSGDGAAGDGTYGYPSIPGSAANTLVRYRIVATGAGGSMYDPRDDDTVVYRGFMFPDASLTSLLPIFHWFIDPADYAAAIAHRHTDETEPAVLVYDGVFFDGVQIRVRGQSARNYTKKHWKFIFPQGHEFEAPGVIVGSVDRLNLQGNWGDKAAVREILSHETFAQEGTPPMQSLSIRVQQNGQFYGLYTYVEQPEGNWMDRVGLDDEGARYKAFDDCRVRDLATTTSKYEKKTRLEEDHSDLKAWIDAMNQGAGQARRDYLFDNVNLPAQLAYMASTILIHNNDAPAKNYYVYRDTEGTGRWTMQQWDMDLTFGRNYDGAVLNDQTWADVDVIAGRTNVSPSHPQFGDQQHEKYDFQWNRCIDALLDEPEVKEMFYRHLRTQMDDMLADSTYDDRIDELVALMAPEHALDVAEWGQYGAALTVTQATDLVKTDYLQPRRTHLFTTHRVPGEIPDAQAAAPPIVITEIMYNPVAGAVHEFLELYNPSLTETVDLSGWTIEGLDLTIPYGTVILPDTVALIVNNDAAFRAEYGGGNYIPAEYPGRLSNSGESIVIRNRVGTEIDRVDYEDFGAWPSSPDGGGTSLELIDVAADNNDFLNWSASIGAGGTPGASNSVSGPGGAPAEIRINEVLVENATGVQDENLEFEPWIELYNASIQNADISGWYLSDDIGNPTMWQIPASTFVSVQSFATFWADATPVDGPMHTNFALNPAGGTVYLFDSFGTLADSLSYSQQGPLGVDVSEGRLPDGTFKFRTFVAPTPGAPNQSDPGPVLLNEYNGVGANSFLGNGNSDTYWGQILGNGGDWFELVVTEDLLDMRGWKFFVSDDTGGIGEDVDTLVLTSDPIWSSIRTSPRTTSRSPTITGSSPS